MQDNIKGGQGGHALVRVTLTTDSGVSRLQTLFFKGQPTPVRVVRVISEKNPGGGLDGNPVESRGGLEYTPLEKRLRFTLTTLTTHIEGLYPSISAFNLKSPP